MGYSDLLGLALQTRSPQQFRRYGAVGKTTVTVEMSSGQRVDLLDFETLPGPINIGDPEYHSPRPVFIPAVEMMGHLKGFAELYDEYELDFDETFRDITGLLKIRRRTPAPGYEAVVRQIETQALEGTVVFDEEEDRYYLTRGDFKLAMTLVAEGLRKIASLHTLLVNGSIKQGTILFWDEPDANLNPVLMDEVVQALVAVARTGVQVFIATHSYIFLEEIADETKKGEVRYFGFEKTENGVTVNGFDTLPELQPNPILRQYESLYNRQIERAFAGNPPQ